MVRLRQGSVFSEDQGGIYHGSPVRMENVIYSLTKLLLMSLISSRHNNLWSLMKLLDSIRLLNFKIPCFSKF